MTADATATRRLAQIAGRPGPGHRDVSTGIARALEDLRRNAAGDLKELRRNWGDAYEITGAPVWRAKRRDSQVTLIATSPGKLRDLITANYNARPVPRSCPCPQTRGADEALARAREGLSKWPGPVPSLPADPQPHPLVTPGEVADAFKVDPRAVLRWEAAGELDSVRLPSGFRRYFRAQVETLLRGEQLTPEQIRALREELASPRTRPGRMDATAKPRQAGEIP
jgi:hypothetical protein